MTGLKELLFSAWTAVEHLEALKSVTALIFGGLTLYAINACLELAPIIPRKVGETSSPGVRLSRLRKRLWCLAFLILLIDVLTVAAYLPVWFAMQGIEKPTSFPAGQYLYLRWGLCLAGVAIQIALGILFRIVQTKVKGSK